MFDESKHPRDKDGKFTDGNSFGGSDNGDKLLKAVSEYKDTIYWQSRRKIKKRVMKVKIIEEKRKLMGEFSTKDLLKDKIYNAEIELFNVVKGDVISELLSVSDCIEQMRKQLDKIKTLSVAPAFAEAIKRIDGDISLSEMFN